MMENRWSDRRELRLVVDLFVDGGQKVSCLSQNIGLGGAFLSMGSTDTLSKDAGVKLVFYLMDGPEKSTHTLNARVVRICSGGVGLKFKEFDTGVFRTLQKLMTCEENYVVH